MEVEFSRDYFLLSYETHIKRRQIWESNTKMNLEVAVCTGLIVVFGLCIRTGDNVYWINSGIRTVYMDRWQCVLNQ
jgi:hypothetical protein